LNLFDCKNAELALGRLSHSEGVIGGQHFDELYVLVRLLDQVDILIALLQLLRDFLSRLV
jgi:hypothetical protein